MAVADPLVMPLALELLDCLEQEIAKVEDPPLYVGLRPGNVVDHLLSTSEDECCSGLAWVRPSGFWPSSSTFPTQDTVPLKGSAGPRAWAVVLELGSVRCSPTPDANSIPSNEEWLAVTQAVMDDAAALRRAICCFTDSEPTRKGRVITGQWQPLSVQGGCVGGIIPVTIQGPACDCAEAGPVSS
jgi:hypothetical protein